eukprot:CAMPEP_0115851214 /NCGR_PEP_ID=MMETSP0287-20121206/12366_1 /TAXON_ID=412157 /ORGANISM="Chrysochromulina rotalis, Strain UIO044" /LENGTH=390 /DNA_ID=CAMNT_0003305239 /DNA_START=18 /DNA_END=1186 /DNA_ORIENTATION=-
MPPQQTATKPAEKKRKRNTGISIFQSDAPTKTARKKADEFSIFDHGVNRDAAQSNSSSWLPLSQPATFTAATAMPGVPMRRTRSRGLQPDGPSLPFVAAQPLAPHAGLGAAGIAGASTGISAASAMMAAAAAAQAEQAAQAARMLPPPLPLQPTLSEWGTLGLDLGAGPEGGGLSGVEMRRTRSRGLPSTADPSISALPGGGMGLPPPPRSQLHAGSMGRPLLPPALPMMPSLSEAALAIGLDMNEAVEALQGSPGGARLLDSPGGSPSPRRRGRHAGVPTAAHAPVAVGVVGSAATVELAVSPCLLFVAGAAAASHASARCSSTTQLAPGQPDAADTIAGAASGSADEPLDIGHGVELHQCQPYGGSGRRRRVGPLARQLVVESANRAR